MCKINKESCSSNARLMMIGIPTLLICFGIMVIIEGAKMIADSGSELVLLQHYKVPSQLSTLVNMMYLLVAVGPVMLVMGFLGAFVCLKDSKLILLLYCLSLLISFIVEVSGATAVLVYKNSADQYLNSMHGEVKKSIQEEYGDNEEVTSMWNSTMDEMKCCGFKNYRDFDGSPFDIAHGGDVYPSRTWTAALTGCRGWYIQTRTSLLV
ncbi:tetraspanin-1-like isoform X2 [Mugil cephalus]|uniref:tetraspanin-1-like isoform X2 n=1 Tax=Mugil cephalus TaxID=48193 RepID=UPI001FB7EA4F|nr:tetraspanin-1-like isoform X2 [Mugil cephalus]